MIPGKIVRFLDERANVAMGGTRDGALVPHGHHVTAWHASPDGRVLTVCVPYTFTAHLLEAIEDNGLLAVTLEDAPTHETYQFKGRCLGHRPVNAREIALADRARTRFVRGTRPLYPPHVPDQLIASFAAPPSVAIELTVDEIYLQTPGPAAGRRLVPPEDDGRDREPRPDAAVRPPAAAPLVRTASAPPPGGESAVSLPDEIRPALEEATPSAMVTCSGDGVPNSTIISQVYYVDPRHVALSFQFFSKTIRNVRENPRAYVAVPHFEGGVTWVLQLGFERSETSGPVFEAMDMQIEAIASATGMSGIFRLRAADIYQVLSVTRVPHVD